MSQSHLTSRHYSRSLFAATLPGTPEVAGLTPIQGMEIVRGCRGLNLIGADVVEVYYIYVLV